jgi:hypothetical protein
MKLAVFLLSGIFLITGIFQAVANEPFALPPFKQFTGLDRDLSQSLRFAEFNNTFMEAVERKTEATLFHTSLQHRIQYLPAGQKIAAFFDMLNKSERVDPSAHERLFNNLSSRRLLKSGAGGVAGQVTVNSTTVFDAIEVFAFDEYGFPVGASKADMGTGDYILSDLEPGNYYIVPRSQDMDKLYTNFPSESLQNWQDASMVRVAEGMVTSADFDLKSFTIPDRVKASDGSVIQGTVLGPDSVPVAFAFVFSFNIADTSISGFTLTGAAGEYMLTGLGAGSHIVFANHYLDALIPPAAEGEYYSDAKTPSLATPLVTTGQDTLTGIDFSLDMGGTISGEITDANGTKLEEVLVIAFKSDVITALLTDPSLLLLGEVDFGLGISDSVGAYSIPGLSSGNYILRTVSLLQERSVPVLDEYYGGGQSLFDFFTASPVAVTSPNTTQDINFDLDPGAIISGHFYEVDGSTPVDGVGSVFALNAETGLPELAFPTYNADDGSYALGPLPTGQFKLFSFVTQADSGDGLFDLGGLGKSNLVVENDHPVYLPQFYDGKAALDEADPVAVTAPAVTPDINFRMVRAGSIYGLVSLPTGNPAGADTLETLLIVAYDSETGAVAGATEVTFDGGYTLRGLPPGRGYKVAALPATQGYAATYYGGGTSFDSPNAKIVTLLPDDLSQADIQIAAGMGSISGDVTDSNGQPLSGVLVIAYDLTGHAVSAGLSGFDVHSNLPAGSPSAYQIEGLIPGQYYLRTVSLFRFLQLLDGLEDGEGLGSDPFSMIFGLLGLGSDLDNSIDLQLHEDQWYDSQPISIDLEGLDIFSLLLGLITSEGNPDLLLPLYDVAPSGAQTVSVSGPTPDIDFVLSEATLSPVSVEEEVASLPDGFELSPNYPNPFNPSTQFRFSVPRTSDVKIAIYNTLGQRIRTLFDGPRNAGTHTLNWDGQDGKGLPVSSGIYLVQLETEGTRLSRKMLLVR